VSERTLEAHAALSAAAELHRSGRLDEAVQACRRVLERGERTLEALLLLSSLEHARGHPGLALGLAEQALEANPRSAQALLQRALVLRSLGRLEEALASYEGALALRPDFADAHYNCGNLLQALGRREEALASFDAALALAPRDAAALNNRAVVLLELGRPAEALASCERALALRPCYPDALNNRGTALFQLGRWDEALASYDEALAIEPRHAQALNNRGNAAQALGRCEEALENYAAAIAVKLDYAEAHNNRAAVLLALDRAEEALVSAEHALAIGPLYAEALNNRGSALQKLGRCEEALASHEQAFAVRPGAGKAVGIGNALHALGRHEEALASYERALAIDPVCVEALNNRGNALQALKRYTEALASYVRAAEIAPADDHAHWNEALCRLALGDYLGGWQKYEWRRRRKGAMTAPNDATGPEWTGAEDIAGRRVLVYTEQGHGDALQFIRYAALLAARGAEVIVGCHASLKSLFATVKGVAGVIAPPERPPRFDYHVPLMSLPRLFGTTLGTIPACVPYLRAEPRAVERWGRELARFGKGFRVGLVWMGNPEFSAARAKSCGLAALQPLVESTDCIFVSLQKGEAASDIASLGLSERIIDRSHELATFSDTAALISNLDLVISTDTAVAHLAGALGKPVWVLLQYAADWRWLVDREESPWYPSARLFRQQRPADWSRVIARVAEALPEAARALSRKTVT
jgi:tetratricopeptide (TPR) repeat protein